MDTEPISAAGPVLIRDCADRVSRRDALFAVNADALHYFSRQMH
jgi:hypothetical protein